MKALLTVNREECADCFANKRGRCVVLTDNNFKGGCPFYKNKDAVSWEEIEKSISEYRQQHSGQ